MKAAGVQMVMLTGDDNALVAMMKAMQTVGWYPDAIVEAANQYKTTVTKNAGSAVKNLWVATGFAPFEAADQVPAVKQFADLMQQYNPSGVISSLSLNAWNAWTLFATAATACGSNLTRACLMQKAGSFTDWTGGGIQGPVSTDFANRHGQQCLALVKGTPAGFVLDVTFLPPNKSVYNCSPDNVVRLKGNYSG
jgi:ABC-type branched-subunit amino acid transport system substrate-binding protein